MPDEKITHGQEKSKVGTWVVALPRLLVGVVGLVLLAAAVLKATDMELFIRQIRDYDIISHRVVLSLGAWGLIALECGLAVGLLVFYRPTLTLPLTAMLLLTFVAASVWAWMTGATEDCGCFGAWLKHTPAEATLQNLTLLAALVPAWMSRRKLQSKHARPKAWAVTAGCLVGLVLPVAFGFPVSGIIRTHSPVTKVEFGNLKIQGLDYVDLQHGTYLIILTDTDCQHCQEAVPQVNVLTEAVGLDGVIALSKNDEPQRVEFIEEFGASFPVGQISEDDFWRLLGEGDIPRFILVQDGGVLQVWDRVVPDKDMISSTLTAS